MQFGIVSHFLPHSSERSIAMQHAATMVFWACLALLGLCAVPRILRFLGFVIKVQIALWTLQFLRVIVLALLACWVIEAMMRQPP
jgi:hypothetical protein